MSLKEPLSEVIAPLRSRCVCVRLPAPSVEDLSAVLHTVAQKEKIKVPEQLATNIACARGGGSGGCRRCFRALWEVF